MLRRADFPCCRHDLIQEPAAEMAAISNATRNAAPPRLQCHARRIWKENGDIETRLASKQTHSRKEAAMRERNNFVYLRDELTNRGDLCRRGNGDVRVGSARLDGAHSRDADDGIAQPIARANQNAKRL